MARVRAPRPIVVPPLALALGLALSAGCAGKKAPKTHDQWVEDCVFEKTLPRDQCEQMWEDAHPEKK